MEAERKRKAKDSLIVDANNQLAISFHRKLSQRDGNLFFSPFSISMAMGMLLRGVKGKTLDEMLQIFGYKDAYQITEEMHKMFGNLLADLNENEAYILAVANAAFCRTDFKLLAEYQSTLKESYQAIATELDFAGDTSNALNVINDWVKEKTRQKIPKLLTTIDPNTIFVLLNAIYFKGSWVDPFDPNETRTETFYNGGVKEKSADVPMMFMKESFRFTRNDTLKALELPYQGDDISMLLLLPNEMTGIKELKKLIDASFLKSVRDGMCYAEVEVTLPKFRLDYSNGLKAIFQELGIRKIFDSLSADFSGLSEAAGIEISEIIHKAVLEVNEQGSEAAAATATMLLGCSMEPAPKPFEFYADHPFCLVIYNNDMILFMGSVDEL